MLTFTSSKEVVAQFASDLLNCSESAFASITITRPGTYVDSYALTVIGMSSEDIVKKLEQSYLKQLMSTS